MRRSLRPSQRKFSGARTTTAYSRRHKVVEARWLHRAPSEIRLSQIVRLIDGPLAPFGDADQLRHLIARDAEHRALYRVFLEVRDAAAKILENTTIADIIGNPSGTGSRKPRPAQRSR